MAVRCALPEHSATAMLSGCQWRRPRSCRSARYPIMLLPLRARVRVVPRTHVLAHATAPQPREHANAGFRHRQGPGYDSGRRTGKKNTASCQSTYERPCCCTGMAVLIQVD